MVKMVKQVLLVALCLCLGAAAAGKFTAATQGGIWLMKGGGGCRYFYHEGRTFHYSPCFPFNLFPKLHLPKGSPRSPNPLVGVPAEISLIGTFKCFLWTHMCHVWTMGQVPELELTSQKDRSVVSLERLMNLAAVL